MWNSLGIHYEVVNICTGDMGTVASKKYDLEAWIPGADQYKEIVSCSNCTDYQANRLSIRYGQPGHPNQPIVHTLNSTAVATSRALVAIMEQYQLEDGRGRAGGSPALHGRTNGVGTVQLGLKKCSVEWPSCSPCSSPLHRFQDVLERKRSQTSFQCWPLTKPTPPRPPVAST